MISERRKLVFKPMLQQQLCGVSCTPTCVAMAIGMDVNIVVKEMTDMGVFVKEEGTLGRMLRFYLMTKGIGAVDVLNQGLHFGTGHFLLSIPSLNKMGAIHHVLLVVDDEFNYSVYDPNNGRLGHRYHSFDSFGSFPVDNFTILDDFSDIPFVG